MFMGRKMMASQFKVLLCLFKPRRQDLQRSLAFQFQDFRHVVDVYASASCCAALSGALSLLSRGQKGFFSCVSRIEHGHLSKSLATAAHKIPLVTYTCEMSLNVHTEQDTIRAARARPHVRKQSSATAHSLLETDQEHINYRWVGID